MWVDSCRSNRRRSWSFFVTLAAGVLLLALPAAAQGPAGDEDPAASAFHRYGAFAWSPAVVFSTGYDTNPYREARGRAQYETFGLPEVEAWWVHPGVAIRGMAALEYVRFAGAPGGMNSQTGFEIRRRNSLIKPDFTFTRRRTNAAVNGEAFTGLEIGYQSVRVEHNFESRVSARVSGRSTVSASGRRTQTRWEADAVYEGSDLREKLNRDTTFVGADYGYAITPLTSVGARIDVGTDRFHFSPIRDGDTVRVSSYASFARDAVINGGVAVGYERFKPLGSGAMEFRGLVTETRLGYGRPDGTLVHLMLTRSTQYSFDTSLEYFLLSGARVTAARLIADSWQLGVFANYYSLDYRPAGLLQSVGRVDTVWEYGTSLARGVGRSAKVGVSLERAAKHGAEPYDALRVVGFLTYGPGRFTRLDRPNPIDR
jgi:hypothetical protein